MIEGVDGVRIGLHVCRGNWSRKEEVLLTGDYERLLPAFTQIKVKQFVLEYATPRAATYTWWARHCRTARSDWAW